MTRSTFLIAISALLFIAVNAEAELGITTVKEGDCSSKATVGDTIAVHYVGKLASGKEFDASRPRGDPLELELGSGMVIQGWEKGIEGACLNEVRNLVIPPHLGYGDRGYPPVIPEKATLHFEVEIMKITPKSGAQGEL